MKNAEEKKVVADVAMLAPASHPNGVHVSLTDGRTFFIAGGETPTDVPEDFQAAALEQGAVPADENVAREAREARAQKKEKESKK